MLVRARRSTRRGQISFVTLFAIMALLILFTLIVNVGRYTGRKVQAQSAADASAHAAGVRLARAMNEITAVNHLIGELNALCILAFSFGGLELAEPGMDPYYLGEHGLTRAYRDATRWSLRGGVEPPDPAGFIRLVTMVRSPSSGAIGPSRQQLKVVMPLLYRIHAAGAVMAAESRLSPYLNWVGRRIVAAALVIEKNVLFEWSMLRKLERLAEETLIPTKEAVNHGVIPALHEHARLIEREVPALAEAASRTVALRYRASSSFYPNTSGAGRPLGLPVVRENGLIRGNLQHSQVVRATTPWVRYGRKPILAFGRTVLPISRFAAHYRQSSNHYTLLLSRWLGPDYDLYLHVLADLDYGGPDKGAEPWTRREGSRRADELFGTLGLVRYPPPEVLSYPIYRDPQPDGLVAAAQVMLYNANPQNRPRRPRWQPVVGWDTLNWDGDVPEWEFGTRAYSDREVRQPRIRLNWQVKLVPITLLGEAVGTQPAAIDRVLGRTVADRPIANTH